MSLCKAAEIVAHGAVSPCGKCGDRLDRARRLQQNLSVNFVAKH